MRDKITNAKGMREFVTASGIWPWRRQKSPEEILEQNSVAAKQALFVMKKHDATRLHYDLRLSYRGVLLSWAVLVGPSYWPGHQREAIQVPDHNRDYAFFEGCKAEGYGAGTIMVWDWGTWEPLPSYVDVERALRRGELKFTLRGEKLAGVWILRRVPGYEGNRRNPHWVLIKEQDAFARAEAAPSILEEAPNSVSTNRTLQEIDRDWKNGKPRKEAQGSLFAD